MNKNRSSYLGLAFLCGVALGVGCKPKRTTVPPLCTFDALSEGERETQSLTPITWLLLASPTVDRETMLRQGDLTSACGQVHQPVLDTEAFECPGFDFSAPRIAADQVEETDLVISQAGENRTLLWAATDELESGESEGAAALALWAEGGLEIHAVGSLRAYRDAARMRLHSIGGTPVLILQSDRCAGDERCVPIGHVVPILNRRLREVPLWEAGRGCVGRAQFELEKREERPIGGGWSRRFILTRSLELTDGGIEVTDLLRMEDFRPKNGDAPARPFRKVSSKRPLVLRGERLELDDESLWERSLRDHGKVASGAAGNKTTAEPPELEPESDESAG